MGRQRFGEFIKSNETVKAWYGSVPRDWKIRKLSAFLQPAFRAVEKPSVSFLALGIRSHGLGTFLKNDFDPRKLALTTLYMVKENDLIVNITFAWEGAIAVAKEIDDGALVSHRFPTYEFQREIAIPEYFKYVILQKWIVHKLGLISPGGAGRNRVLNKKDFLKIEVAVPSVPEQQKIAFTLDSLSDEIRKIEKELLSLKEEKNALIQVLLTGKVRVKTKED